MNISSTRAAYIYCNYRSEIDAAAQTHGVPQALIVAVIDRESGGNNIRGDNGHGRGLMQIDDRSHAGWVRSHNGGLEPRSNIDFGTMLLAEAVRQFLPDVRSALAAYNAGVTRVMRAIAKGIDVDQVTTDQNYSRDVLARAKTFDMPSTIAKCNAYALT